MEESNKEVIQTTVKSLFGAIPYAGTALNEVFFEYHSRIKQKRLNNFTQILAEYFEKNQDVKIDNIKNEHFADIFEAVLKRVVQTKSESKLKRFRTILINELKDPTDQIELVDLYLDLISSLSEEELNILYHHRCFDSQYEGLIDNMNNARDQVQRIENLKKEERIIIEKSRYHDQHIDAKEEFEKYKNQVDSNLKYRKCEFYELDDKKFIFYKQRLFSKGLLIDNPSNRIGSLPFHAMGISEFGKEFIEFIQESK